MSRLTIQNRITTFMVIFTIILISAFTAIQLYNQLQTITIHNTFRARLVGTITKNDLEGALDKATSRELELRGLQAPIQSLAAGKVAEEATIFTKDGRVAATTNPELRDATASLEDQRALAQALEGLKKRKWFFYKTTKRKLRGRELSLFIPLSKNERYDYVAKLTFSLGNMRDALLQVYKPCIFTASVVVLANIFLGTFLSRTVIGPIRSLDTATDIIAAGNLEHRVNVKTDDELEDLANRFNHMTVELVKMKERAENANPLTRLPGNNVIQEETTMRIQAGRKFVIVHSDLDNFKAFNDKYGLAKGDDAIKLTAEVMREALQKKGNPDDFIGHEGGDDFVFLTTPDRIDRVTSYITSTFDKKIRDLYTEEDKKQGFIMAKSRQGVLMKFPIMSISLAGVTNQYRPIESYAEVTNITAEVKKKAKAITGSSFVLDKRLEER